MNLAFATVGRVDSRVEYANRCAPDIGARAITFDERDDAPLVLLVRAARSAAGRIL